MYYNQLFVLQFHIFLDYKDEIDTIKQKITGNSEKANNQRKQAVFNYINSLPLNQYQKLMLQKMAGGYSIKNYESQMFNYINSLDLTKEEKQNIHKELFG